MKPLVRVEDLQTALDKELAWRIQELSDLSLSLKESKTQRVLLRGSLALLYAHWEGFVKQSATHFLTHVLRQRLRYSEVCKSLVFHGLKSSVNSLTDTNKARLGADTLALLQITYSERVNFKPSNVIKTKGNLSSERFEEILTSLNLDPSPFQTKYKLIDVLLLERRNKIAHGEYIDVPLKDFESIKKFKSRILKTPKHSKGI